MSISGLPLKRKEDARLLRGGARYLDDLTLPGMLHLGFVRSPHAHARVKSVDVSGALRLAGVTAALTLADLPALAASVPPLIAERHFPPYRHPILAGDRVRHVGEAVAVVLAESAYRAADAVAAVDVEYEPLPAVLRVEDALKPDAPRVHDEWPGNLCGKTAGGRGDVAAGLAASDVVVEGRFTYARAAGAPIETRGVVAAPAPASLGAPLLTVWSSTQVPFAVRSAIASVLGLAEAHVRVIVPEVGGGFGVKGHVYPEEILVAAVARHMERPVKWVETRREHFATAGADRDQAHAARLGATS